MNLCRPCKRLARTLHSSPYKRFLVAQHSTSSREFKVTLDGQTLYVEKDLAQALGWAPGISTDGISLRLSGWEPHYFAITQTGTDADRLARGTIESSRNPRVQQVLEYLKKADAEVS